MGQNEVGQPKTGLTLHTDIRHRPFKGGNSIISLYLCMYEMIMILYIFDVLHFQTV